MPVGQIIRHLLKLLVHVKKICNCYFPDPQEKKIFLKEMACHVVKMRMHSAKIALRHHNRNNSVITV